MFVITLQFLSTFQITYSTYAKANIYYKKQQMNEIQFQSTNII